MLPSVSIELLLPCCLDWRELQPFNQGFCAKNSGGAPAVPLNAMSEANESGSGPGPMCESDLLACILDDDDGAIPAALGSYEKMMQETPSKRSRKEPPAPLEDKLAGEAVAQTPGPLSWVERIREVMQAARDRCGPQKERVCIHSLCSGMATEVFGLQVGGGHF